MKRQAVLVPVIVTDEAGRFVDGLERADFGLFEDGVKQPVDSVLAETSPLTVAIVIDSSGSMTRKMEGAQLALERFLDFLKPGDRALVIAFNETVRILQGLTGDRHQVQTTFVDLQPEGGTGLYDAVVEALYELHRSGAERRALLIVNDGMDNASINTRQEAIRAARATATPIYAIGVGAKRGGTFSRLLGEPIASRELREVNENNLRDLAESSGGRAFFLADLRKTQASLSDALRAAYERVARELRSLYFLAFQPRGEPDGPWHRLSVEVLRPNVFVRFRPGYLAVPLN